MPIYNFKCTTCDIIYKKLMRITDDSIAECPECGSNENASKMIGRTSFILKGTGWYKTDYASGGNGGSGNGGSDNGGSDNGGSDNGGSDTSSKPKPVAAASESSPSSNNEPRKSEPKKTESSSGDATSATA